MTHMIGQLDISPTAGAARAGQAEPSSAAVGSDADRLRGEVEQLRLELAGRDALIAALREEFEEIRRRHLVSKDWNAIEEMDELRRELLGAINGLAESVHGKFSSPEAPAAPAKRHRDTTVSPNYMGLVSRIRRCIQTMIPPDGVVLVVSKGDGDLLKLEGRPAGHFPQNEKGIYAGHNPGDSAAAVSHLEALRAKGARYLVFPQTAFWWLEYYKEFRAHLDSQYRVLYREDATCAIYALADPEPEAAKVVTRNGYGQLVDQVRAVIDSLLPRNANVLVISRGDDNLLRLGPRKATHFPQNEKGGYAGYNPADSEAATAHLNELRAGGAQYLVLPQTANWWLEYYEKFAESLLENARLVTRQAHVCTIYELTSEIEPAARSADPTAMTKKIR
jgi:hypothetical protein